MTPTTKGPRLVALFLIGALLFNYPLLALFERATLFAPLGGAAGVHANTIEER
jgi:hypothetical protein